MDTLAVIKMCISIRKNRYTNLFVSDTKFMYVVPMQSKIKNVDTVKQFTNEIGVSMSLIITPRALSAVIS